MQMYSNFHDSCVPRKGYEHKNKDYAFTIHYFYVSNPFKYT